MYSIRNGRCAFLSGIILAALAGCQTVEPQSTRSPLNDVPLIVDPAMQARGDWDRSTAHYATGASVAGGTDYVWQTHEGVPANYRRLTEAPVAVLNFFSIPVGAFTNSSAKKHVYRGESVPPTFHANPPVPGEPPARSSAPPVEAVEPVAPAEPVTPAAPAEPATPVPSNEPVTPIEPVPPVEPVEPVPAPAPSPAEPPVVEPVPPAAPPAPDAIETPEVPLLPPPPPAAPPADAAPQ